MHPSTSPFSSEPSVAASKRPRSAIETHEPVPAWASTLTHVLDDWIRIPGTRFSVGLDALLGFFLPGVGDALTGATSLGVLWLAVRAGVPKVVLLRMLVNIGVDAIVGSIPVLGDLFDAAYKSNRRNLALLRRHASGGRVRATASDYVIVGVAALLVLVAILLPLVLAGAALRFLFQQF